MRLDRLIAEFLLLSFQNLALLKLTMNKQLGNFKKPHWWGFRELSQIERWWEIVSSAYWMVSLQFWGLGDEPPTVLNEDQLDLLTRFRQHRYWNEPQGWKQRLNNVQLLIQPFLYFCSIKPWLAVFDIPDLRQGFVSLLDHINQFPEWLPRAAPHHFSSA